MKRKKWVNKVIALLLAAIMIVPSSLGTVAYAQEPEVSSEQTQTIQNADEDISEANEQETADASQKEQEKKETQETQDTESKETQKEDSYELADHMEGVADADLEVEVAPNWSELAIEGFSFSDSKVTENGDKLKIEFTGHSLEELKDQKVVFKIRFKGYKLWAINGDIKAAEHRLFEGLI